MTKFVTSNTIRNSTPFDAYPVLFYLTRTCSTSRDRSIASIFLQTNIIYKN